MSKYMLDISINKTMERANFWQEFFQLYKDMPSLWRVRSTEYTDRELKSKCYEKLVAKLKEVYPEADREMVVKKINNFRTSYRKEVRRVKECEHVGIAYKPSLWYYDYFSFLGELNEAPAGKSTSVCEDDITEELKESPVAPDVSTIITSRPQITVKRCADSRDKEEELPTTSKRTKVIPRIMKPAKLSREQKRQSLQDADTLAKSWALQYNEMHGNQKLIARKLISDILFHGCLGSLNMTQTIEVQEVLLKDSCDKSHLFEQPESPIESNSSYRYEDQEFMTHETNRESSMAYNSSSPSMSPNANCLSEELEVNGIKIEYD